MSAELSSESSVLLLNVLIHLNNIRENTIENARNIREYHHGPDDSVAINQVTISIPAP